MHMTVTFSLTMSVTGDLSRLVFLNALLFNEDSFPIALCHMCCCKSHLTVSETMTLST